MFSVIKETMKPLLKKRFKFCYETFIDFMIYSVSLFLTETLNSYRHYDKAFTSD